MATHSMALLTQLHLTISLLHVFAIVKHTRQNVRVDLGARGQYLNS